MCRVRPDGHNVILPAVAQFEYAKMSVEDAILPVMPINLRVHNGPTDQLRSLIELREHRTRLPIHGLQSID